MTRWKLAFAFTMPLAAGVIFWSARADTPVSPPANAATKNVEVAFAEGHETVGRDRGRPVILIAAALGVPAEVFREAFSHVKPAPAGQEPDPEQVRRNKQALMDALAPYGVTDERLNEVSNYYRYNRSRGEMWRTDPAAAHAVVKDGKIVSFVVTHPGAGYSSIPTVQVPGFAGVAVSVKVAFTKLFSTNGSITSIDVAKPIAAAPAGFGNSPAAP